METATSLPPGGPGRRARGGQIGTTCILVVALFLLAVAMGTNLFIVPQFKAIFADFGAALSAPTVFLIQVSDMMRVACFVVIPLVVVAFLLGAVLTWLVDYRAALVLGLVVCLLSLVYLITVPLFLMLPVIGIVKSVKGPP